MDFALSRLAGKIVRLAAVIAVAATLGACSIIPDWMGGDSGTPSAPPPPDQTAGTSQAPAQTADANNGQFPDLADTPDRPAAPSTSDEQQQVASSLASDRNKQNYSADQLRAGQETAAAPPGPPSADNDVAEVDTSKSATASGTSSGSDDSSGSSATAATTSSPAVTTAVASAPVPSGAPAVPAVPAGAVNGAQSVAMTDAALGFQPSKAPPLDASVAQFVPQPIMSRYQQTASIGGTSGIGGAAAVPNASGPAVPVAPGGAVTASNYLPPRLPAMGGPEMSGAVVANFDALQGGSVVPAAAVYANPQGLPPVATVSFSGEKTILSADAKEQVKSAADAFNARGGMGYIRVVGHASSRSAKMSEARRMQIDFEHSQARATSIARELIKDGVPANKVLVEAVGGAAQPAYSDPALQSDDSGRRAEIFFQG